MSGLASWLTADILSLGMAADEARRAARGGVATYLRVHALRSAEITSGSDIPAEAREIRVHDLPASLDDAVDRIATLRERVDGRPMAGVSANCYKGIPPRDSPAVRPP